MTRPRSAPPEQLALPGTPRPKPQQNRIRRDGGEPARAKRHGPPIALRALVKPWTHGPLRPAD